MRTNAASLGTPGSVTSADRIIPIPFHSRLGRTRSYFDGPDWRNPTPPRNLHLVGEENDPTAIAPHLSPIDALSPSPRAASTCTKASQGWDKRWHRSCLTQLSLPVVFM